MSLHVQVCDDPWHPILAKCVIRARSLFRPSLGAAVDRAPFGKRGSRNKLRCWRPPIDSGGTSAFDSSSQTWQAGGGAQPAMRGLRLSHLAITWITHRCVDLSATVPGISLSDELCLASATGAADCVCPRGHWGGPAERILEPVSVFACKVPSSQADS